MKNEVQTKSKVVIHMVSSLDGFIATKEGDVSWMQTNDNYEKGITLADAYIEEFLASVDCYLMGSKTYEHALKLGWPYGDTPVYVLTHRELKTENSKVKFIKGDLGELLEQQLKPKYQNIWMVGGSALTKTCIKENLADEIVLTFLPIILGDGLLFFDFVGVQQALHLKDVQAFKDGMVELTYEIIKK